MLIPELFVIYTGLFPYYSQRGSFLSNDKARKNPLSQHIGKQQFKNKRRNLISKCA